MNKQYNKEEFEKFAIGLKKISDILRSEKPDFVFAPVVGSVPLIDLISISDRHFNLDSVEYPPNSSRFLKREDIMSKWYSKFLKENYYGEPIKIICIDEIISGSSAIKGYKEFQKAIIKFKQEENENLERKVKYNILGPAELPKNKKRNHGITRLVNKKIAKIIEVGKIITSDNPDLNYIRLKSGGFNAQGREIYLPEIEFFKVSPEYITLLQNFASYMGADPKNVSANNLSRIKESLENYLLD